MGVVMCGHLPSARLANSTLPFTGRKICKTCKCKPEEHDIKTAEEEAHKLVVHSLFSKDSPVGHIRDYFRKLEEADNTQRSEYAKQFAWCPPGLQQGVVCILFTKTTVFL